MAENPDRKTAERGKLAPSQGDLRFVKRQVDDRELRILQRWEYSYVESQFDWFDVPLKGE